jgi:ABC-type Fe3+/spermidine/putrescine transport system ATPase subunit
MSNGRIEQIGTPAQVYDTPASRFVAGFIGHSSRFDAVVDSPAGMIVAAGQRLHAMAARPSLYGARVTCFIRPEHVRLDRADAAPPGALPAVVTGVEFLGAACRVSLEAGPLRLLAAVAPAEMVALEATPGAALAASLPPERVMVFADDA